MPVTLRLMLPADVADAELAFDTAYAERRGEEVRTPAERTSAELDFDRRRCTHLLRTDPDGSWVAQDDHSRQIVGVAQAIRREDLWVLAILGVLPSHQGHGIGRQLLAHALDYSTDSDRHLILSTSDPRALRMYVSNGFLLHPALQAEGVIAHPLSSVAPSLKSARPRDLDLVELIDKRVRGASRRVDLLELLELGSQLLLGDEGYAVVRMNKVMTLAALNETAAENVLLGALSRFPRGQISRIAWLTSAHQWAIRAALQVGLIPRWSGAVMTKGWEGLPNAYLPNGMFG